MKVLMCSRAFPKGHPKQGQPTYFVEKVFNCFRREDFSLPTSFIPWTENYVTLLKGEDYLKSLSVKDLKHHTIRAGNRFKPGDMASLRVWSDKPYRSKQVEFAQVEVKKVWPVEIYSTDFMFEVKVNGVELDKEGQERLANNDGLSLIEFYNWFNMHPKKKEQVFKGQIICWGQNVNY